MTGDIGTGRDRLDVADGPAVEMATGAGVGFMCLCSEWFLRSHYRSANQKQLSSSGLAGGRFPRPRTKAEAAFDGLHFCSRHDGCDPLVIYSSPEPCLMVT